MKNKGTAMRTAAGMGILAAILMLACPSGVAAMKFLSFGTGSPAGTYYFIGAGFE